MTTTVPPATNNSNSAASAAALASTTSGLADSNFQDFLQLLTTQLQNQDPTDPTNTDDLTQEIASLSQVEQQISTNNNLQQLITLMNNSQFSNDAGYIGKQVDATGNSLALQGSQGLLAYSLPSTASSVTVNIVNSAGQTVFSAPGTTVSGYNEVAWDGATTAGTTAPDGNYTFNVTATDSSGKAITATTYTSGIVTAVDNSSGTTNLDIGTGLSVPFSTVVSIRNAPTGTSGSTDTSTSGNSTQNTSTGS